MCEYNRINDNYQEVYMITDKIGERIKKLRTLKNLNQVDFARALGISQGFLSDVENGKNSPNSQVFLSVKRLIPDINSEWLLTGEGEMFRNKEEKQEEKGEEKQAQEPPTPSPAEPHKIKQLEQKVNYLYKVISERSSEFQLLPSSSESVQIPFYAYAVSAGIPDLPPDDSHDLLTLDKKLLKRPKNAFAVRVSGTSMIGAGIADGDILVIERATEPIPDKIFIFNIPGEGYTVKILQKRKNGEFWLKPSNPKFKPTKLTPALQASLVGRVVLIIKSP
jgi:DNA polymerase V